MKKSEFEEKIKELNLEKIYHDGRLISYSDEESSYYMDNLREEIYGCHVKGKIYIIFFTDLERGMITELGRFHSEDEAYQKLFNTLIEWKKETK